MATDPIRPRTFRSRIVAALSLSLLLVVLAGSVASGAVPPSSRVTGGTVLRVRAHVAFTPPATSCQGLEACKNVVGTVGENACNGIDACYHDALWTGTVGDGSCNGLSACALITGNVGKNACDGPDTCYEVKGGVGAGSCDGDRACEYEVDNVGNHSCNGVSACDTAANSVGSYACNGDNACTLLQNAAADCTHNVADQVPAPCFTTRTAMGSSADPAAAGEAVRLWATVFARYPVMGKPGGTFRFRIDGRTLPDPVAIDRHGRAVITRTLRPGIHWVSGRYLGDGTFAESIPVPLPEIVVVP
jgi:hypothetical protein